MGASVVKVEPPGGDPLARMCPGYYEELSAGQEVVRLDLKDRDDRVFLDDWLGRMDLLLTASRPAALGRLGLSWPGLRARFPRLCQVALELINEVPHLIEVDGARVRCAHGASFIHDL